MKNDWEAIRRKIGKHRSTRDLKLLFFNVLKWAANEYKMSKENRLGKFTHCDFGYSSTKMYLDKPIHAKEDELLMFVEIAYLL